MKIHSAGHGILARVGLALIVLNTMVTGNAPRRLRWSFAATSLLAYIAMMRFFRIPIMRQATDTRLVLAPSDGKVIAIENGASTLLNGPQQRITIYLSLLDAHLATAPVAGKIVHSQYNPGQYLLAFHPKASDLNENQILVIENDHGERVQVKLIAGFIARRILTLVRLAQPVKQNDEIGFIKFGSRVEVLLPSRWQVLVQVGQHLHVGATAIARMR